MREGPRGRGEPQGLGTRWHPPSEGKPNHHQNQKRCRLPRLSPGSSRCAAPKWDADTNSTMPEPISTPLRNVDLCPARGPARDRTISNASTSRSDWDLDDLLLDRVLHQLRFVVDVEFAH